MLLLRGTFFLSTFLQCYVHKRYQPLPFQVRKPAEIISDDVVILTPWTCYYHNALVISLLGDLLHGPGRANLHGIYIVTNSLKT